VIRSNWPIKVAAVASSLLLVGGFVSYRAGAFTWLQGNSPPPSAVDSGSGAEEKPPVATGDVSLELMYGSKSGFVRPLKPAPGQQAPAGTTPSSATMMGTSKSIILVEPASPAALPAPGKPGTQPPAPSPSSKPARP
jgi:hypothetical protein